MSKYHAIFGPPGTGKSTHLSNLVKELSETVSNMAVVSFTKAAAGVLTSRITNPNVRFVGTLHSLAFRALNLTKQQVADDRKFATWYGHADTDEINIAMSVYNYSYHKNCSWTEAYTILNPILPYIQLEHLIMSYSNWVATYQYVTFNAMIDMATHLFNNGGAEKFDVIVVDEAQDLTDKQWSLIITMLAPGGQVYMGGDDDQAVYTWCGANPHTMVELADVTEVLGQSYRIPSSVHGFAERVVRRIGRRAEKEYKPRDFEGVVEHAAYYESVMYPNKHTVLCRDKWVMKEIEDQLIYNAVPYTCGPHRSFYDSGRANLIRAIILEDYQTVKKRSRYLRNEYKEDPTKAVKVGWQKAVDFGHNETEARYLSLLDHEAEPLIHLSTIHGAKGEEDNHIVLMGQCPGKVECAMDATTSYDDEIRVWYVGITRAKERLTVIGGNQYIQ